MKILHLTHTDIRTDSRILKELSALEATGLYELHAIGMAELDTKGGVDIVHSTRIRSMRLLSRSMRWLPSHARHLLTYLEMLFRVLAAGLSVRPRLIHCHDTPLLPMAAAIALLCRSKVIYDAHELESDKNGQTRLISRCTLAAEKFLWRSIDGFVTVSGSILRWYESGFSKKDAALVYNSPVFSEALSAGTHGFGNRYFHQKYGIDEDRKIFVYLGLLGPGRGIETLLDVFSRSNVHAHIVFVGRGSLREEVVRFARDNDRIHLHGVVPHNQVVPLVRAADYGVCMVERVSLSDYYSLPNKLFEYAFAGVPVLASNFPDMRELVERFGLGVCAANDADSIAEVVSQLQDADWQRITSDIASLGWQTQAEKLTALYRRLLQVKG